MVAAICVLRKKNTRNIFDCIILCNNVNRTHQNGLSLCFCRVKLSFLRSKSAGDKRIFERDRCARAPRWRTHAPGAYVTAIPGRATGWRKEIGARVRAACLTRHVHSSIIFSYTIVILECSMKDAQYVLKSFGMPYMDFVCALLISKAVISDNIIGACWYRCWAFYVHAQRHVQTALSTTQLIRLIC